MLKNFAKAVPGKGALPLALQAVGAGTVLIPQYGIAANLFDRLEKSGMLNTGIGGPVTMTLGVALTICFGAKFVSNLKTEPKPGIWIGKVFIPEKALWTSILITGRPGSGKTSGAIMPLTEQLFLLFNGPETIMKDGIEVENPYAKLGGLVLEVKGTFYEYIGYIMQMCGRDAVNEYKILRPDSDIPVAEFMDPENGNRFFVNAIPSSKGSEAGRLALSAQRASRQPASQRISPETFSAEPIDYKNGLAQLKALEYTPDKTTRYIGWRIEGDTLVRITHTSGRNDKGYIVEPALDSNGAQIRIPAPKKLQYIDRIFINNGLCYNLVDNSVGPSEAAEKLTVMGTMTGRGEGKNSQNSYWTTNGQKLMTACITLARAVEPDQEVTCSTIHLLVASPSTLNTYLKKLENQIAVVRVEINMEKDPDKKRHMETHTLAPLEINLRYFKEEWATMDEKQKTTITSVVTNTFSMFTTDPALKKSCCSPRTFRMAETMQKGWVYCFVPGRKYESQSKIVGTGYKVDWQNCTMNRKSTPDANQSRVQLHLADECWNWIISAGAQGGDEKFLSLCREPRIINLLATQNYSQFVAEIGRERTETFLAQFGVYVWLQNFDEYTNRISEGLMEEVNREKREVVHNDMSIGHIIDGKAQAAKVNVKWEKERLYKKQDFIKLSGDEAIAFNGYESSFMAEKTELPKSRVTHPAEEGNIEEFMRDYLQAVLENALYASNRMDRVSHITREDRVRSEKAATPPAAAPDAQPKTATPKPETAKPATPAPSSPSTGTSPDTAQSAPPPETTPDSSAAPAPNAEPAKKPGFQIPRPTPGRQLNFRKVVATPGGGALPPLPKAEPRKARPSKKAETDTPAEAPAAPPPITTEGEVQAAESTFPQTTTRSIRPTRRVSTETKEVSPRSVDAESELFKAQWGRLAVAAEEVISDDELGLAAWLEASAGRKGNSSGGSAMRTFVGPRGVAAGSNELAERVLPVNPDSIPEKLDPQNAIVARSIRAAEQAVRDHGPAQIPIEHRDIATAENFWS